MSHVQRRHHSRGSESVLTDALLMGAMLAGTVGAVLVLFAVVGWFLGVFAF